MQRLKALTEIKEHPYIVDFAKSGIDVTGVDQMKMSTKFELGEIKTFC